MNVAVFDYGAGNLHSLVKALDQQGAQVRVESDLRKCLHAQLLVLPGVGAFGAAASRMAPGVADARVALARGLPCLGVCLGMQLMFESSEEGEGEGLGVFKGRVTQLKAQRVPQIGWNRLDDVSGPPFTVAPLEFAYFANGYVCRAEDESAVVAWSTHESDRFPAAVRRGDVLGVQFHPEKSSATGLAFIAAFLKELSS